VSAADAVGLKEDKPRFLISQHALIDTQQLRQQVNAYVGVIIHVDCEKVSCLFRAVANADPHIELTVSALIAIGCIHPERSVRAALPPTASLSASVQSAQQEW